MRLSTGQIYDSGTNGLLRNQYDLYRLQNQLSTGRRAVTPADDPVAAAQALITSQKQSVNSQFMDNQANAKNQLAQLESQMAGMGNLMIEVKSRWVEAGNGAYSDSELKALAVDLRQRFDEMLGYANSADATGMYLFAGYMGNTQPFANTAGTVSYQGDGGQRQLQVESGRFMNVSYSGTDVFERIRQGNGTFVNGPSGNVLSASANSGTGIIDNGTVNTAYDGNNYQLVFTRTPNPIAPTDSTKDTVTYQVYSWAPGSPVPDFTDPTASTPASTSFPYTPGDQISLPDPSTPGTGVSVSITGDPATGDSFNIAPSQNESVFTTLRKMIDTLEGGRGNQPVSQATFQNDMMRIGASIDMSLQHVLDSRADVGANLAALDALTSVGEDMDVQYQAQLSELQDLDYTKAISDLAKEQLQLQAAQQSFMKVTSLSLFNFL